MSHPSAAVAVTIVQAGCPFFTMGMELDTADAGAGADCAKARGANRRVSINDRMKCIPCSLVLDASGIVLGNRTVTAVQ